MLVAWVAPTEQPEALHPRPCACCSASSTLCPFLRTQQAEPSPFASFRSPLDTESEALVEFIMRGTDAHAPYVNSTDESTSPLLTPTLDWSLTPTGVWHADGPDALAQVTKDTSEPLAVSGSIRSLSGEGRRSLPVPLRRPSRHDTMLSDSTEFLDMDVSDHSLMSTAGMHPVAGALGRQHICGDRYPSPLIASGTQGAFAGQRSLDTDDPASISDFIGFV